MKKILFILAVLMTANLFAQTPIKIWDATTKSFKILSLNSTSAYTPMPVMFLNPSDPTTNSSSFGIRDSVKGADTTSYNFANVYLKCYVTVYNSHATLPDTLALEHYSQAKAGWTYQAIGFRDVLTDYLEADNSTIIIPALTTKMFEINIYRPGNIRARPKNVTGRTTARLSFLYFKGIN